jgi:hypothetical protein
MVHQSRERHMQRARLVDLRSRPRCPRPPRRLPRPATRALLREQSWRLVCVCVCVCVCVRSMDPILDVCVREPIMDPVFDVCVREPMEHFFCAPL